MIALRSRCLIAEALGSFLLFATVIGSGIMAERLSGGNVAVALLGKIMCYAIAALAMDLIWGYTGILSLGHGV